MNLREIVIFVAGPYNGDIKGNIEKAENIAAKLWDMGFTVYCPHANTGRLDRKCKICTEDDFVKGHLIILERCDALFMMSNWKESFGAQREHQQAKDSRMPIFYSLAPGDSSEEMDALLDWAE